jgi:DNA replicative helicase MCM subunit Mcm2 (Cdc46/Mcm family)
MTARQELESARLAWKQARIRLDQETNPDLIDAAIYEMQAAEKRISVAWKRIRAEMMVGRGERAS